MKTDRPVEAFAVIADFEILVRTAIPSFERDGIYGAGQRRV